MSTQDLQERRSAAATVAFLLACACTLIAPALAGAATVTASSDGPFGRALTVQAGPGELNTLTTTAESLGAGQQRTTFNDETTPLVAGAGCVQATPNRVTCETDGTPMVSVLLDDGNDRLTFDSASAYRVVARGGTGDDVITDTAVGNVPSYGNEVFGEAGNDQLSSRGLVHGGDGNDRIEGGPYADSLIGGTGNDAVFGREGNDALFGGNGQYSGAVQPGSDLLDGGVGDDTLDDQDRGSRTVQQINSDSIIGGLGDDTVNSYLNRVDDLHVDLSEPRRDGQSGEGDDVTGVENVTGGDGDDELYGDGDANRLFGGGGDDDIAGRGGDDMLTATQGDSASGDVGRDRIVIFRDSTGYIRCASGRDSVTLLSYTADGRRRDTRMAARISKTCERMQWNGNSFRPTPTRIRQSGLITFGRLPFRGARFLLTRATPPYVKLARLKIPAGAFSVQLPRDLVRKHKKTVRVVIGGELLYRFRLGG
jgi:Ca2+-binding RTX toxin-like protein